MANVTIEGNGFTAGSVVKFDGTAGATTYISSTDLSAVPPAHAAGTVDVEVDTPSGASVVFVGGYTYEGDLVAVDFTALALGAAGSLPGSLSFARASDATAQVGTQSLVLTVGGNDVPAIGQRTDAQSDRGLVVEPARTNVAYPSIFPTTSTGVWAFAPGGGTLTGGQADPASGTTATRIQLPDAQYTLQLLGSASPALSTWSMWVQNNNAAGGAHTLSG